MVASIGLKKTPLCAETCKQHSQLGQLVVKETAMAIIPVAGLYTRRYFLYDLTCSSARTLDFLLTAYNESQRVLAVGACAQKRSVGQMTDPVL